MKSYENSKKEIKDLVDLYDLASEEGNQNIIKEIIKKNKYVKENLTPIKIEKKTDFNQY